MPKVTIETKQLKEPDLLRLRILKAKARIRALGIKNIRPFYEYRHGKVGNELAQTYAARQPLPLIVDRIEALAEILESGEMEQSPRDESAKAL